MVQFVSMSETLHASSIKWQCRQREINDNFTEQLMLQKERYKINILHFNIVSLGIYFNMFFF